MEIRLVQAAQHDIDLIMGIETLPGYDLLVGHSSAEEHRERMSRPGTTYWLATMGNATVPAGEVLGFGIVTGLNDPHGGLYLLRIAVKQTDKGIGRAFVRRLISWAFDEIKAPRFWLDVFVHNERARHVYKECGFVEEGLLRSSYKMPDGARVDRVVMSILPRDRVVDLV